MIPRFVVSNVPYVHYRQDSLNSFTARQTGSVTKQISGLSEIQSDNIRRKRPLPPLGVKAARANGMKLLFVRDPKPTQYVKTLSLRPVGSHSYVIGQNPDAYPIYWVEGGPMITPPPDASQTRDFSLYAAADARIKSRFFGKLKNSEFDLAITLAERAQTRVMIAKRAVVLFKAKSLIKAVWKRARARSIQRHESIAKAFANAWLEFVYGWKQLANDIFGIIAFAASRSQSRWVKTRTEVQDTFDRSVRNSATGIQIYATEKRTIRSEMKIRLNVTADPVLDLTRLSTLNPIAIAWELLPFSFVFDWILNISKYLGELQTRAMFHSAIGGGYITHTELHELVGFYPHQNAIGTQNCSKIKDQINFRDSWCKKIRTVNQFAPLPAFPSLKCPLSLEHALTTLSLITQRLKPKHLGRAGRFQ